MERAGYRPDIEGAIQRSRAVRAARQRRRRRLVLLACASILLGGGTAVSIAGFDAGDAVEAAVKQTQSLAELLSQRSPGHRTAAELTKTKRAQHARAKVRMAAPKKVALLPPVTPTAVELAKILLPPPVPATFEPVALLDSGPPPILGGIVSSPGVSTFPSPGGVDLTPPGGSTTPPGGSTNPPGDTIIPPPGDDTHVTLPKDEPRETVPVTPLPEPGTWAMMLLGFGLIGWRIRCQPRAAAPVTA